MAHSEGVQLWNATMNSHPEIWSTAVVLCRPTAGYMNWCSRAQIPATTALLDKHVEVGVHEVLHAIGFSAGLWRRQFSQKDLSYFLKPDASGFLPYDGVNALLKRSPPVCC